MVLERDGTLAGQYRKMHIPDDPGFHEKFYFTPGDLGFTPIDTSVGRLGVLVCWDQWYPEAARLMALHGAEILLYPTAIGWDPRDDDAEKTPPARRLDHRSSARMPIANGLPMVVCNRVGLRARPEPAAPGIQFWGSSFIAGPQGEILAQAADGQAGGAGGARSAAGAPKTCGASGRFCATGASTPIAICSSDTENKYFRRR